jgi:hypothetical protein
MPTKLKNTTRLKAYKKEDENISSSSNKDFNKGQSIRSDGSSMGKGKFI